MKVNSFFDHFPAPKFLNPPFSGLSISDGAIRTIQFVHKNKSLAIGKYSEKVLPPGIISGGQVNNKDELINIISEIKKELNLKYVKFSLPEEKAYLFTAKIPIVHLNEIKSAIESKIEENVPVSPGELMFDYKIRDHKEKEHFDVVVSTLQISVSEMYADIAEKAGVALLGLEIESQAIARALLPSNSKSTSLIAHFGVEKVSFFVVSFGMVQFTSTVPIKGNSIDNLDFLSQEIKRLYMYWHSLKDNIDEPDRKITEIIISGENFPDSVSDYLSSHNQTKVTLGNVWTNVFDINKSVPPISFSDSLKYAAAIGLALPSDYLL